VTFLPFGIAGSRSVKKMTLCFAIPEKEIRQFEGEFGNLYMDLSPKEQREAGIRLLRYLVVISDCQTRG
jgi:hypothetical protein